MALSNPLLPVSARRKGFVGRPLPGVWCRLVRDNGLEIEGSRAVGDMVDWPVAAAAASSTATGIAGGAASTDNNNNASSLSSPVHVPSPPSSSPPSSLVGVRGLDGTQTDTDESGELRIKGASVFKEYLNRPQDTARTFDEEGWFKTGDIAVRDMLTGEFRILGRNSSDIIKSSGYKLSALEIERELLAHPEVCEACVIGVPSDVFGEQVVAFIVCKAQLQHALVDSNSNINNGNNNNDTVDERNQRVIASMPFFLSTRLAKYKQPRTTLVVEALPRNALGKINKKSLLKDLNIVL